MGVIAVNNTRRRTFDAPSVSFDFRPQLVNLSWLNVRAGEDLGEPPGFPIQYAQGAATACSGVVDFVSIGMMPVA